MSESEIIGEEPPLVYTFKKSNLGCKKRTKQWKSKRIYRLGDLLEE
jgi:hypothetical protein